jgi:purine-nucleoside phosphorylase
MTVAWDGDLRGLARRIAADQGIELQKGVYAAVPGPSFETPAEIRMIARLGGDVVGMSTVPEVLVARALGLRCLGFSLVTNLAAGRSDRPLDHAEVIAVGEAAGERLGRILRGVVRELRE